MSESRSPFNAKMSEERGSHWAWFFGATGMIANIIAIFFPGTLFVAAGVLYAIFICKAGWFRGNRKARIYNGLIYVGIVVALAVLWWFLPRSQTQTSRSTENSTVLRWLAQCAAYLRGLPWQWILPTFAFGGLTALVAIYFVLKHRRKIERARPRVAILSPLDGEEVGWHRTVRGSIYPPDSELQLLIQPSDGWWYVQSGPVVVHGRAWSFNCEFGEQRKAGFPYKVVGVHGTSLTDERYKPLPENLVKSAVITLNRRLIEDFIDCSDVQLHQTKINDKNMIAGLVKVCRVSCDLHIDATDGDDRQYVDFDLWFLNLCLFPVSIESVLGSITFRKETSAQAIRLDGQPKLERNIAALNRPFRSHGRFYVRQFLAPHDVTTVKSGSEKSEFKFHDLKIMITCDGVAGAQLDIPEFVWKGKPSIASGECDFGVHPFCETKS